MKKLLLILFTFTLTFSCLFFGGCKSNLSGEYHLTSVKYYDDSTHSTVTVEVGDEYFGMKLTKDTYILIVEDGEAFLRFQDEEEDGTIDDVEVYRFQWSKGYDNEYYAYSEEDEWTYVVKKEKKQIIFDWDGTLLTFKK